MTARIPAPSLQPCAHCSKPFRPKCRHARFCCRACCSIAHNARRRPATFYGWVPCAECGRPYQKLLSQHRYCTRACKATAHNKRRASGFYKLPRTLEPRARSGSDAIQCWECCDMSWRRVTKSGVPGPCSVCSEPFETEPNLVLTDFLRTRGNLERAQDMAPGRIGISNGRAAIDPADAFADAEAAE